MPKCCLTAPYVPPTKSAIKSHSAKPIISTATARYDTVQVGD